MRSFPPIDPKIPGQEWYYALDKLKGNIALDIGAHGGDYSLRLSRRFVSVYAFEPDPTNRYVLETNIRVNRVRSVNIDPRAVSDLSARAMLRRSSKVRSGSTLSQKHYDWVTFDSASEVETVSLDDWYRENRRPRVGFVKIDAEGHETAILKGAGELFSLARPLVGLEVHGPAKSLGKCECEACSLLRSYGYVLDTRKPALNATAHWSLGTPSS